MKAKLLVIVALALLLSLGLAQIAQAATPIYVRPGGDDTNCDGTLDIDYPGGGPGLSCAAKTIQKGVDLVDAGGTVYVRTGTYVLSAVVNINKAGITLDGDGVGATIVQVSGTGDRFNIAADGVTLQDFEIEKTDKTGEQNIIHLTSGNNVTIKNNTIHGQFVIGEGEVSRALIVNAGAFSGMNIEGNTIYALRQPAYISGTHTGTVQNNYVYGTKGWVLEGGNLTFTGNTWGTAANPNVYDIAILATMPAGYYTDIVAMSNANNGAVIENQRVSPAVLSAVYVDAATSYTTDLGGRYHPYSAIAPAITRVVSGGTIHVAAGTYAGNITINKSLTLLGDPGDEIAGPGLSAPVIDGGSTPGDAFLIANGVSYVTISGFEVRNFTSPLLNGIGNGISAWEASTSYITIQDNYFHHLGYNAVLVGNDGAAGNHTNWLIKKNIVDNVGYIGFELTNTSNSSIEDNVIHLNSPTIGAIFSSARRSETGLTIKNNLIDGTPSTGFPVIYIYAYDLDVASPNLDNVLIEGNTISTAAATPYQVMVRNIGTGTVTNVTVYHNTLSTFRNLTAAQVDAENNYWGTVVYSEIVPKISGDVDWSPWCNSDFSVCTYSWPVHNVTRGIDYQTIMAAITAANAGDEIHVDAGTYAEDVVVNKAVKLVGVPGGASAGPGPGAPVIDGGASGVVVDITANGVIFEGFTVQNSGMTAADAGIRLYGVSGCTVNDNAVTGNATGIGLLMASGNSVSRNTVTGNAAYGIAVVAGDGNTIDLNSVTGNAAHAIALENAAVVGGDLADGATGTLIKGNIISGNGDGIFLGENCDSNQVTDGNQISGAVGTGVSFWRSDGHTVTDNVISSFPIGIRLLGSSNNTIARNYVTGNTEGIKVDASWQVGVWYQSANNTISGNDLSANATAVLCGVEQTAVVNASGNWWGSNVPATVKAQANNGTIVDYTPWLATGTDTSTNPGFQGDLSTLWVDDDSPQTGATGRIQEGIDLVSGSTVNVAAGTYVEDPVIDKAVTLLGPNAAINPNTGTRVAEAVILPVYSEPDPEVCETVVYLEASDVTIKGFTFDGDNPALTSGIDINGADVDACVLMASYEGIGNIAVENNILKNATYAGIDFYNYSNGTAPTSGNYIRYNRIDGIGETTYNWGIGILITRNFYADITDNVIAHTRVGLQVDLHNQTNPGTTGSVKNNQISTWRLGLFLNQQWTGLTPFVIENNTFTAETYPGATKWSGILISTVTGTANATIANNTVNIPDTVSFAPPGYTAGYNVWNVTTSAPIAISGGTVTGGDYGVFVNNYEGYSSNANNTAITIDGVTVLDSNIAGVYVKDSPDNTNNATVYANIQNCTIDTDATDVLIEGTDATAAAYHNRLGGNATYGMNNTNAGVTTNAEYNYWGSVLPAEVAAEVAGTVDFQPWCNYDFTVCDYVFPVHNLTQLIDYPTIQSAVDAANPGDVIKADAGTYVEQVNIGKNLTLQGVGSTTIIASPATLAPYTIGGTARRPIVYVHGATVTVQKLAVDGNGLGNANSGFMGIAYQNAAGTLDQVSITEVRDTPLSGAQYGVALYTRNEDSVARTLNVIDTTITDFQKNGTAFIGTNLIVNLTRTNVTGAGPTSITAQNGIQISNGAGGTITDCSVSGIAYTGTYWGASAILLMDGTTVNIGGVTSVSNSQAGIVYDETDGALTDVTITAANVAGAEGISIRDYGAEKMPKGGMGPVVASPYDGGGLEVTRPEGASTSVTIDNATLTGTRSTRDNDYGIAVWGMGDAANASITNSDLREWSIAIVAYEYPSTVVVTAHQNCIESNDWGFYAYTAAVQDAEINWWGDASGPYHDISNPSGLGNGVTDNVDFEPWITDGCGGTATGANWQNTRTLAIDDLQGSLDDALSGDTIIPIGTSPLGGGGIANVAGVTIDLSGKTVGPGSPAFTINADDITIKGPGILDGNGSTDPAILVNAGAGNFILNGVWVTEWANGIELAGDVTSFKIVNNWIHSNVGAGLLVDAGVDLDGVVTIEGNLFKVNGGNGIQHNGNGTLPAEYNSWGDIGGYTTGDGIGGSVDAAPFTYVESFFDVWPEALAIERHVPEGTSFDVTLKADAVNLYGLSFKFTYDTAVLTLNSTTFASPWAGKCWDLSSPGTVSYACGLFAPDVEWTATGGAIATFNFTAPMLLNDNPVTTYLDLSHLEADTSAAAIGGRKVFVNNAGFNLPSAEARDITDTDDGRIIIERLANYAGLVDLQGRVNDSGATVEVHATSAFASTLLAQATSTSSGAYTTVYTAGNWLGVGSTYWFQVDRALYLPTTVLYPVPAADYAHSKALTSPLTALAKVLLLGGDATDDESIRVNDLACIGANYGGTGVVCGAGWSDVNGDGKVNVQDLSMCGGNLYKTSSLWTP